MCVYVNVRTVYMLRRIKWLAIDTFLYLICKYISLVGMYLASHMPTVEVRSNPLVGQPCGEVLKGSVAHAVLFKLGLCSASL